MKRLLLNLLESIWSMLPSRVKVHLIQSRANVGFLDTQRKQIVMAVESIDSLNRLSSCQKEPETIRWIDANVKKGDVLFDIGANVGAYSLYAAAVTEAKVYSFEPSSSTFSLLLKNIYLNKLSDLIVPFNMPLSSRSDMKEFVYSTLDSGSAIHTGLEKPATVGGIHQPMLSVSLDDLIQKYHVPLPNHMKIDVDGHEMEIIHGATGILKNNSLRSVQIELTSTDKDYALIVGLLEECGLRIVQTNKHPHSPHTDIVFVR